MQCNNKVVYGWFADGLPFYIGIGTVKRSQTVRKRNLHCSRKRAKAERENCFEIRILHCNLSWEEACEIEISLINLYGRVDNGTGILTNMTDGGEGLPNPSREIRERISKSLTGRNRRKETKQKISKRLSGKGHPNYGKRGKDAYRYGLKHSDKSKLKMSKAQSGSKSYRARPVNTPLGNFDTCRQAANAHKISTGTIHYRLNNDKNLDWYYIG